MNIVFVTDVIHPGGAETFVLRLAQELRTSGHIVTIYPLYAHRVDKAIADALAPDVRIVPSAKRFMRVIQVVDGVMRRLKLPIVFLEIYFAHHLARLIRAEGIDVVHSHLFTSDAVAVKAGGKSAVPVVTTIHGDYSAHDHKWQGGQLPQILKFREKMVRVLNQMRGIVCICDEQLDFFKQRSALFCKPLPLTKIYNGFARPLAPLSEQVSRASFGIPDQAFVFCMVARGIPEKGWQEVIEAFQQLGELHCYLLLIGDSVYVQVLKQQYAGANILFLGKKEQPYKYLKLSDAGLFGSKIKTEALPTVIIEYLAAGLPVISTDVGEASRMLTGAEGAAGLLVRSDSGNLTSELKHAMLKLSSESLLYKTLQQQTFSAYDQFEMQRCVAAYRSLYTRCIAGSTSSLKPESLTG